MWRGQRRRACNPDRTSGDPAFTQGLVADMATTDWAAVTTAKGCNHSRGQKPDA